MLQFIQNNAGTLIAGAIVIAIVAAIIIQRVRGRGKSAGCSGCNGCAAGGCCSGEEEVSDR